MQHRPKESASQVVVVHDLTFATHAVELAASLGLIAVCLRQRSPLLDVADLVVDIDLRNLEAVTDFRRLLAGSPSQARRLVFLIDGGRGNRPARVQAGALGATHMVDRALATQCLLHSEIVPQLSGPSPTAGRGEAVHGRTIAIASQSLSKLFDNVLNDQPIDMAALCTASQQIIGGIGATDATLWLDTVKAHHVGTYQHCLLVAGTAAFYARHTQLAADAATALLNAALLHDIGKALIPLSILDKPAALSREEMQVVRQHPDDAYDYMGKQAGISPIVLDAILHHHEFLDGSGYPHGLAGPQINPLTRILTVCDVFAALTEDRPYKPTYSPVAAIGILRSMAREGKVDGSVVDHLASAFGMVLNDEDTGSATHHRS